MIVSFVGVYFIGGVKLVWIWFFEDYVCVGCGGIGKVKMGGNYVFSFLL